MSAPRRVSSPLGPVARVNARTPARSDAPRSHGLVALQRAYGNQAVGALLERAAVQRAVGWPEATGWNKGGPRSIDAQHKLLRVALAGLAFGNRGAAPDTAKTTEQAADDTGARAVVWLHPDLDAAKPVQVIVHLHGLTHRSVDPFPGWRENVADPRTTESAAAKQAALATALKAPRAQGTPKPELADMPNPLGNKVRDVERDRIGQQIEALGDPQVMAVLPQGTGLGGPGMFGADFDPDALVADVLTRLVKEPEVTRAVRKYTRAPASYTIVASAHSGGGSALASALRGKRTARVGGLILFDALWAERSKKDPGTWVSAQRQALLDWVRARCTDLGATLRSAQAQARKDAAVDALPGVHGYYTGGVYAQSYKDLEAAMHRIVDQTVPRGYAAKVKAKFRIRKAATSHDRMLGEVGASSPGVAPLEESLRERRTFVSRQVQAPAAGPPASPPAAPPPTLTREQQADQAADRVRDAVRPAAAPLVGTQDADDIVGILTQQLIRRERDPRPALRRRNPAHPALPLYDVLYGATVVADLATIDTQLRNRRNPRDTAAADAVRRRLFMAVLDGLVTDARPRTAVVAPANALDPAVQVPAERALVPRVLPLIDSNRTWEDVRLGVITEFGGLVDGTRTALARANAYFAALQPAQFRNVTRNTRVHPDMNAAFARAETWLAAQLAAMPAPRRTQVTGAIATVLGRGTWSANLRENRNSPHRLSDHSFGFAIDIDSSHNPNISSRGGLEAVQDVTGDDPRAATSIGRTAAQIDVTAADLRTTSDDYRAAMTDDASLAPVLLRLANAGRARTTPPLPPLANGAPLVAAIVQADAAARAAALRAAIWPEGATAPPAVAPPAPAGRGRRQPPAPAAPAPPPPVAAAAEVVARVGRAFRESFRNATRTTRAAARTEATRGSVAAHGFLNLPSLLVAALAGSDAGNLRWLGTETGSLDFMHFELGTRPALYTAGAIADPAPPDPAHGPETP